MVHGQLVMADYGPTFIAWIGRTAETMVCVATPQVEHNAAMRCAVRELVQQEGADCATCGNCLMSRGD